MNSDETSTSTGSDYADLRKIINGSGYTYFLDRGAEHSCETTTLHALNAIADGADPQEVFCDEEAQVHHLLGDPFVETPRSVVTVPEAEHRRLHSGDYDCPDASEVVGVAVGTDE